MNGKRMAIFALIMALSLGFYAYGAITVSSPSSADIIESPDDFPTMAFQDPWDMNQQTDLGWFIYDVVSGSKSNLTNVDFSSGIFSASATSALPNISVLETGVTGTAFLGKIGYNYKIDASKYRVFAMRMKVNKNHDGLFYWTRNTIYNDYANSGAFPTYSGWRYYIKDIPSLGWSIAGGYSSGYSWSGDIDSLRLDPSRASGINVEIDWIRLVEADDSLYRTIGWSGHSGTVDIYLDTDKNEGNGTLGVLASGVSGSSYNFYAGALEPGVTYYVGVKNSSGGSLVYSAGYYKVNDIPTLTFTSPSEEGGDDFATVELGDPWDMNALTDIDTSVRVTGETITNINAENQAGDSLGSVRVYKGTSTQATTKAGDPVVYLLSWWNEGGRGDEHPIDASKYRIFVVKMGLPGNWDLVGGSIARVVWQKEGEDFEHVSADLSIRHKNPNVVISTMIADMTTILEEDGSSGKWTGMIKGFRFDPHEFPQPYDFYIQEVKLAAFERADKSYLFEWTYTDDYATSSSLSLYYDTNDSGYNGTLIASGINPVDGEYSWNTTSMANGTYYIYATFTDGVNTNQTYARWPIVIDHSATPTPTISLNKTSLTFSASGSNSQTFTVSNSGSGTLNWTASDNQAWMSLNPTSGQDSGTVTVTVDRTGLAAGSYSGTITVSDSSATNSPQTISVSLEVSGGGGSGTELIALSRERLNFGAHTGGTVTGPQTFLVSNSESGTMNWTTSESASWLSVSPASGTNDGLVTVTVDASGLAVGSYSANIEIASGDASNTPQTMPVYLDVYKNGTTSPPFGTYEIPKDNANVASSIVVGGWVLDDIEVASVEILNGDVHVGWAVMVDGARWDVEGDFPATPKNYMAGWGYMLLTNFLPNGGNGTYHIKAVARDAEGKSYTLGTRTINVNNKDAVKPFGAIDTPTQGGTASGDAYPNWGWVLTPQPNIIPEDGSTIEVWVDGDKIGGPDYGGSRDDLDRLFPDYRNSGACLGLFMLDTTAYENDVYEIYWYAVDSAGNKDGMGSRYFTIQNLKSNTPAARSASGEPQGQLVKTYKKTRRFPGFRSVQQLRDIPNDKADLLRVRRGFEDTASFLPVRDEKDGIPYLEMKSLDRITLQLKADSGAERKRAAAVRSGSASFPIMSADSRRFIGYLQAGNALRPLPVGSSLNTEKGIFYWHAAPGFLGTYDLVFIDKLRNRVKRVKVKILPH